MILPIDEFERLRKRDKVVVAMDEMPAEFVQALGEPYFDADQAALDHLLDA